MSSDGNKARKCHSFINWFFTTLSLMPEFRLLVSGVVSVHALPDISVQRETDEIDLAFIAKHLAILLDFCASVQCV